jgi:hypothetical protein
VAIPMLTFQEPDRQARDRGRGLGRREFLRIGGLGLGGLALSDLLALRTAAGGPGASPLKDRSVIFLFMHGGPSQFETFDPKMEAPSNIRSATGEIPTSIPGITFGSTFVRLARLAHKFSIVRSFATGDANHDIKPVVGKDSLQANLGSLYSRIAGTTRPSTAMPTNVALFPRSIDPQAMAAVTDFGNFEGTGDLGRGFAPFVPGAGAGLQQDMALNLPQERLNDRRSLLTSLDAWRREAEQIASIAEYGTLQDQAWSVLLQGVSQAFDLGKEDPRIIARYDTAPLLPRARINPKWKNIEHYATNAATLGRQLLLARRLCERGAGFVTVTTSFIWDMHADENNAPMTVGMDYVGRPFDHAVSAFIEDVESRGLSDRILLVCCGEMGRTPRLNKDGGRDHWGSLAPLLIYGGGLKMGQVIGQSSRDGGEPASDPVTMADLIATIMHSLLDIGEVRLMPGVPRAVVEAITRGEPIRGLV